MHDRYRRKQKQRQKCSDNDALGAHGRAVPGLAAERQSCVIGVAACLTVKRASLTPAAPYAALLLRVTLGLMFLSHLYWKFKILPGGFHTWWSNFHANGYSGFVPWYAISAEVAGALLLIPGIYTRWVCLYALPPMVGASHFWLIRKGYFFTAAGAELPIAWSIMLLVQAMLGDGAYAIGSIRRLR